MIERNLDSEILKEELTTELLVERYEQGHPDVVASRVRLDRAISEKDEALDSLRAKCQEGIQLPGRWIPEAVTLEEWRGIKTEIQRQFNAFDVLRSDFNFDSRELLLEALDFDVRFRVRLIKQGQSWAISSVEQ
jgi:hypothetical protein